ncbi:MAG: glycosyltransferase family 2 protein [Bdellovibrionota bacterium]
MKPIISVIIPMYNCDQYIKETIGSVVGQDFTDWEVLAVDDCSTDNTYEVVAGLARLDSRVKLFKMPVNTRGPAGPRNYGINIAQGKYICFLDSDDIWPVNKLSMQYRIMEDESADFSSGEKVSFMETPLVKEVKNAEKNISDIKYFDLLMKNKINTSAVMLRKDILKNLKFDEDVKYAAVEDYKLWLDLHRSKPSLKSIRIKAPLMNYRVHRDGISRSKLKQLGKVYRVLKSHLENNKNIFLIPLFLSSYVIQSLYREQLQQKFMNRVFYK